MKSRPKVSVTVTPSGLVLTLTLAVLVLAALGLGIARLVGQPGAAQDPASARPQSGGQSSAPRPAGAIVVSEPFDSLARWQFQESSGPAYRFALKDGQLEMEASGTAVVNYLTGTEFRDGSAEVDARWVAGDVDPAARFGIIVRRAADGSAIYFEYYPYQNGLWVVTLGQGGKFTTLAKGNLAADRQRPAGTYTRMRIDATGGRANLYLNDALLGDADVSALATGQVGLITTAGPGKRATFGFDTFVIRR